MKTWIFKEICHTFWSHSSPSSPSFSDCMNFLTVISSCIYFSAQGTTPLLSIVKSPSCTNANFSLSIHLPMHWEAGPELGCCAQQHSVHECAGLSAVEWLGSFRETLSNDIQSILTTSTSVVCLFDVVLTVVKWNLCCLSSYSLIAKDAEQFSRVYWPVLLRTISSICLAILLIELFGFGVV